MPESIKPEVAQEIIDWLAIGEFKTVDEFKAGHNKKFPSADELLKSDVVKNKIGGIVGTINVELKNIFKTYGVELSSSEIEEEQEGGKKVVSPKKIAEVAAKKIFETNNKIQEDLKKQIGTSTDERLKKWEEDYGKLKIDSDKKDEIILNGKTEREKLAAEKEEALKLSESKINEFVKGNLEAKLFDEFPWADEANDLTKEGFTGKVRKIAKFDLDVTKDGKKLLVVRNSETGEQFEDPTKKGVFLSPEDFLKAEGMKYNKVAPVYKINESGGAGAGNGKDGGWWKSREKKNGVDDAGKPPLASKVSKNLPSTVKQE